MASSPKTIWVYDHFSSELPTLLGRLYVNGIKGGELYSFEYEEKWLERTRLSLVLDPDLMPFGGRGNLRRRQGPLGKAGRPVPYPPGKGGRHAACVQCLLLKLRETFAVSGLQFGEAAADAALQPVHTAVIHQKHQGGDHPSHRVIQGYHFHGGPKGHRRQKP